MKKNIFSLFFLIFAVFTQIFAQIPSGFYNTVNGTKGKELQTALNQIINNHRSVSYGDVWIYYQHTDLKPNGKIWDIYSDNPNGESAEFDFRTDQCVNISSEEGVCYTREHSFCQSWFGGAQLAPVPATDIFHLYPVDGWINTKRNDNPYGKVINATHTYTNGSKMGQNTYPGAPSVSCYEPIDAYKGDIARSFFYMATRYMFEDETFQENSPMTNKSQLKPWALNMLLEWHQLDPVSNKEIDRNNAIYAVQKNRNPFIDHPEWVAKIWGNDADPVQIAQQPQPEKPNIKWFALIDNRTLKMTFSQPMVAWTTENPLNYRINEFVSVTSLDYLNDTLTLHIGGLFSENATYNLSVKHLLAKNMAFLNDTAVSFVYPYKVEQKPLLAWTFDDLQKKPNTPKVISANYHLLNTVSEAVLYCDGTYLSSVWVCANSRTELDALVGTVTGDPREPVFKGMAIAFSDTTSNGKSVVFKFPTKGYFNLALSMAVQRTATGFNKHQWEWSLDGENYTLIENATTCPITTGEFVLTTLDLRTIEELDDQEAVFLRLTFNGGTGTTGNNRMDNITLHGVSIHGNSINTFEKKNRIIVAPNPTTGVLNLIQERITNYELGIGTLSEVEVEIFDIYGKKQQVSHLTPHVPCLINISNLAVGIYFLKIGNETVKVIKQ